MPHWIQQILDWKYILPLLILIAISAIMFSSSHFGKKKVFFKPPLTKDEEDYITEQTKTETPLEPLTDEDKQLIDSYYTEMQNKP